MRDGSKLGFHYRSMARFSARELLYLQYLSPFDFPNMRMFRSTVAITHMRVCRSALYFRDCALSGNSMRHATRNAQKMRMPIYAHFSRVGNLSPKCQVRGATRGAPFPPYLSIRAARIRYGASAGAFCIFVMAVVARFFASCDFLVLR